MEKNAYSIIKWKNCFNKARLNLIFECVVRNARNSENVISKITLTYYSWEFNNLPKSYVFSLVEQTKVFWRDIKIHLRATTLKIVNNSLKSPKQQMATESGHIWFKNDHRQNPQALCSHKIQQEFNDNQNSQ